MFCIHCGKQVPDSARFCPFCGQPMPEIASSDPVSHEIPAAEPVIPEPVNSEITQPEEAAERAVPEPDVPEITQPEEAAERVVSEPDVPEITQPEEAAEQAVPEPSLPPESAPADPAPPEEPVSEPVVPEPADARISQAQDSAAPVAPDLPDTTGTEQADDRRPLLKWVFIGLVAVAIVALIVVIWGIANYSPSSSDTQIPSPQTPSVTTPDVTTPDTTPKTTVPGTTPTTPTTPAVPGQQPDADQEAVPQEGEVLYEGHSSYPEVSDITLRFILSADRSEIHDVSITCEGLSANIQNGTAQSNVSISKVTEKYNGRFPVNYNGTTTEIKLGSSTITSLTFAGESAQAELDYIYHMTGVGMNAPDTEIPFGTTWFELEAQGKR